MATVKTVLPDFAELLTVLATCTRDDVEEVLEFAKLLQRGREDEAQVPSNVVGVQPKMNNGITTGPNPECAPPHASTAMIVPRGPGGGGAINNANNQIMHVANSPPKNINMIAGGGPHLQHQGIVAERDRSPRRGVLAVSSPMVAGAGNNPFMAPPINTGVGELVRHDEPYFYQGHPMDPRVIAEVEAALGSVPPGNKEAAKNAIQYCKTKPELNNGLFAVFGKYCRNCYLGGVGFTNTPKHTMMECRIAGNPCMIPCKNCHEGGLHWSDQCPGKKKLQYNFN